MITLTHSTFHMAREAYPYIIVLFSCTALSLLLGLFLTVGLFFYIAAALFLFLTLFVAYFFRDPEREIPSDIGIVVSPADGKVTKVEKLDQSPKSPYLISIFLSPLDVHINRSPISGQIKQVNYVKGKFVPATRPDASLVNEQNVVVIEDGSVKIVVKQIAGIIARRCVLWKKEGEKVLRGERLGL
ncbi:MAG: phosphatidylserine decarboxylase family protein, partial [Blastocatellia bacterium]|nr:phosphatidylserine decarboxylase family protein [Blastocatellia bacterium]